MIRGGYRHQNNRDIAEELIIALGTVKSYTNQIYGKLSVQNRVQAVTRNQELALLEVR
jgi:ATP/maltotriose-dependent transcriptional regulator MalT